MFPDKLYKKLKERKERNNHRSLTVSNNNIDFYSNDYLGFASEKTIYKESSELLKENNILFNGAGGSRLLSGNYSLYPKAEKKIAMLHGAESALIFNSGYDANIGFFSSVPQRGDIIFYDESIHASIREGISLSYAKSYKFKHNDITDLQNCLRKIVDFDNKDDLHIYIVTESVFSMDGDSPDLKSLSKYCETIGAYLVVDEAHAIGVFGLGLVQKYALENKVFARLVTFGKGLGCHGAAFLGSYLLKDYLINYTRSFIYTTALPPHSIATIMTSYDMLLTSNRKEELAINITTFKDEIALKKIAAFFIYSDSAIQSCIVSNSTLVKELALKLNNKGFEVKPILSPTVKKGKERLRIILHSFNTQEEIKKLVNLLSDNLK